MFKKWLYYFLDKDGRSYFEENGQVKSQALPKPLENTPDGWEEIQIGYKRDLKKWGMVRSFTLPLKAERALRTILRTLLFTRNIEEKVYLLIQRLYVSMDTTTYRLLYKYFYRAEIDFSKYRYEDSSDSFTLLEGGVGQKVKAFENTTYELDIDKDPEAVTIKMDGFNLQDTAQYIAGEEVEVSNKYFYDRWYAPVNFINNDGKASSVAYESQFVQEASTMPFLDTFQSTNCIAQASPLNTRPINVRVQGKIVFQCTKNDPAAGFRMVFNTTASNFQNQSQWPAFSAGGIQAGQFYTYDIDITIPLAPGERLYLFGIFYGMPTGAIEIAVKFLHGSKLWISYEGRYRTTFIKALKPSTVFKRLAEKIGLKPSEIDTTYIEQFDHLLLTSGDALRGLDGAKLKTSLKDFTEFMRVQATAGQAVEGEKLFFREYGYFMPTQDPVDLGEVTGLQVYPAEELLGNTLKVGYPEQRIDDVNGKASFNNTFNWTSPITRVVSEIDFICPYIADPYYIELTRINLEGKTTTDDKADNEVFVINCVEASLKTNAQFFQLFGIAGAVTLRDALPWVDNFVVGSSFTIKTGPNAGTYTVYGVQQNFMDLAVAIVGNFPSYDPSANGQIEIVLPVRTLRRVTYDQISDTIPDPQNIFNIEELTPKRILLKQAGMINSQFYGFAGQKITFVSTEKNAELYTQTPTEYIREKSDYTISEEGLLFKPWIFEFTAPALLDLVDTLEVNRNRCFQFTWYGKTYKGFLVDGGVNGGNGKPHAYKLLCSPDTDLTNLI